MPWKEKLIIALDMPDISRALKLVDTFGDQIEIYKVGMELFTASGPVVVKELAKRGKKTFLDLKFFDIPNTVSKAAAAATRLGVYMFNVHASGGAEMMQRCRDSVWEVCRKENLERPRILGVTVLTSFSNESLKNEMGIAKGITKQVKHLAGLSKAAGLDGVVASGHEVSMIKECCGNDFIAVTPGIRTSWTPPEDQKRTMTPGEALKAGADYIVMGRAIINSDDPLKILELISLEMLSV